MLFPMVTAVIAIVLASLALALSLGSAVACWVMRRERRVGAVLTRLNDLEAQIDSQAAWWKKLNANMASIRGELGTRRHGLKPAQEVPDDAIEQAPNESPEDWKKRVRRGLSTGKIKAPSH
jgi:hypothetical protein